MKKGIKIILLGGLALALFSNIFTFHFTARVNAQTTDNINAQLLQKAFLSWYSYPTYNYTKYDCTKSGWWIFTGWSCKYDTKRGSLCKSYEDTGAFQPQCFKIKYQGENEIINYLNSLHNKNDFEKELSYAQYFASMDVDYNESPILEAIGNYLKNPSAAENASKLQAATANVTNIIKSPYGYSYVGPSATSGNSDMANGPLATLLNAIIHKLTEALIKAIDPSTYGGYTTANTAVEAGWKVMRNIVNMLLALILVIIAIATIIGNKKYNWKNTLWKVLLVALLVNFSLVITGMLVDISNYFTVYFLHLAKSEKFSISIAKVGLVNNNEGNWWTRAWRWVGHAVEQAIVWLLNRALFILVGLFVIIALIAAIIAMIARAIIIMFLAIFAPVAFAAWALPDTEKWWTLWWDNFIKWTTFGILFSAFLYFGILIMHSVTIPTGSLLGGILQPIMAGMVLVIGLTSSLMGGTEASKFTFAQTGKIAGNISKWTGRRVKEGVIESTTYKKVGQKFMKSRVPLFRGTGLRMVSNQAKERSNRIKDREKDIENLNLGELLALTRGGAPNPKLDREGYELRVAVTNKLARMGKLNKESIDFIKQHKDDDRLDQKAIVEAVPHLFHFENGEFKETGPTIEDKVSALKAMKPKKIENIQGDDFINDTIDEARAKAYQEAKNNNMTDSAAKAAAEKVADETFDKLIQEIVKQSSSPQLAALYAGIGDEAMQKYGWEGKQGKIYKAIQKLTETQEKFNNDLRTNKLLRERSNFMPSSKENKQPPKQHIGFMRE